MSKHKYSGRLLAILISIVMSITVMPAGAFAAQQPDDLPVSVSQEDVTSEDAIEEESTEDSTTTNTTPGEGSSPSSRMAS